jgi:hypothetical protein
VGDYGQCRSYAQHRVGQEGGSDKQTIDEIVKGIADQDSWGGDFSLVFACGRIATCVRVAPKGESFEREKTEQTGEQYGKQGGSRAVVGLAGMFRCIRMLRQRGESLGQDFKQG